MKRLLCLGECSKHNVGSMILSVNERMKESFEKGREMWRGRRKSFPDDSKTKKSVRRTMKRICPSNVQRLGRI